MTPQAQHRSTFPATIDGAVEASGWLHGVAAHENLPDKLIFALEVCLEELFTNVVRHGGEHGNGDRTAPRALSVGVGLVLEHDAVEMVLEDNGRPFDVSGAEARPIRRPLEEVVPGGLGVQLIRSFSNELHYEPIPDGNRVILKFLRQHEGETKAGV
jgi:serine/threonine-protein kinase RsbW